MGSNVGMGSSKLLGSGSSKDGDDVKVVGKFMSTQIPTTLPSPHFQLLQLLLQQGQ